MKKAAVRSNRTKTWIIVLAVIVALLAVAIGVGIGAGLIAFESHLRESYFHARDSLRIGDLGERVDRSSDAYVFFGIQKGDTIDEVEAAMSNMHLWAEGPVDNVSGLLFRHYTAAIGSTNASHGATAIEQVEITFTEDRTVINARSRILGSPYGEDSAYKFMQ